MSYNQSRNHTIARRAARAADRPGRRAAQMQGEADIKMLTDIEIAQQTKLRPIVEIARELGVREEELEPYGRFKAKLNDGLFSRLKEGPES